MKQKLRYRYLPCSKTMFTPREDGFYELLTDRWWVVHPGKGLTFYIGPRGKNFSPQCNRSRALVENLCPDDHEIWFIPEAWLPHDCHDYVQ